MSKKISGIYQIKNLVNGKVYIGSSVDIKSRWRNHLSKLRNNKHHSRHLQRAWDKYGENSFEFSIVEYVSSEINLLEIEQKWIDKTKCCDINFGYNIIQKAESNIGHKWTEESKQKSSNAKKGKYLGENNPFYGKEHSDETKEKMSKSHIGVKHSDESKKKISESQRSISGTKVSHKLNVNDVKVIKEYLNKGIDYKEIAEIFGVHKTTINMIKHGRRWSHVTI